MTAHSPPLPLYLAARYLGVSVAHFRRHLRGAIPCVYLGGSVRRWRVQDLEAWLESQRVISLDASVASTRSALPSMDPKLSEALENGRYLLPRAQASDCAADGLWPVAVLKRDHAAPVAAMLLDDWIELVGAYWQMVKR